MSTIPRRTHGRREPPVFVSPPPYITFLPCAFFVPEDEQGNPVVDLDEVLGTRVDDMACVPALIAINVERLLALHPDVIILWPGFGVPDTAVIRKAGFVPEAPEWGYQ